jgi:hypothetical protein
LARNKTGLRLFSKRQVAIPLPDGGSSDGPGNTQKVRRAVRIFGSMGQPKGEIGMTSFRRLVIGIAEFLLVVSMIVSTFVFGAAGAAIGGVYFVALNSTLVHFANFGSVTLGAVAGFCLGALMEFTFTCSSAAIVFAINQTERSTRPLDREFLPDSRNGYRQVPRF